jgi:hypothetical protein
MQGMENLEELAEFQQIAMSKALIALNPVEHKKARNRSIESMKERANSNMKNEVAKIRAVYSNRRADLLARYEKRLRSIDSQELSAVENYLSSLFPQSQTFFGSITSLFVSKAKPTDETS